MTIAAEPQAAPPAAQPAPPAPAAPAAQQPTATQTANATQPTVLSIVDPSVENPALRIAETWRSDFEALKNKVERIAPAADPAQAKAAESAELQRIAADAAARADKLAGELESLRFEKQFAKETADLQFASPAARDDAFDAFNRAYKVEGGKVIDRATGGTVFNQTSGKNATVADIVNGWKANGRAHLFASAPASLTPGAAAPSAEFSLGDPRSVTVAAAELGVSRSELIDAVAAHSGTKNRFLSGDKIKLSEVRLSKK